MNCPRGRHTAQLMWRPTTSPHAVGQHTASDPGKVVDERTLLLIRGDGIVDQVLGEARRRLQAGALAD